MKGSPRPAGPRMSLDTVGPMASSLPPRASSWREGAREGACPTVCSLSTAYRSIAQQPGTMWCRAAVRLQKKKTLQQYDDRERHNTQFAKQRKEKQDQPPDRPHATCSPASLKTAGMLGIAKSAGFCLHTLFSRRTARESTTATTPMSCPIINLERKGTPPRRQ